MIETEESALLKFTKPGKTRKRWLIAATAIPFFCCLDARATPLPAPEITVQAEHPEQGAIAEHILADAILAPLAQAAIAPKISAPVKKFYVQRGAKVKEGELLATLENSDLAAAEQDNKGSLEAAQAAYATTTKAQVPEDTQKSRTGFCAGKGQSRSKPEHCEQPQTAIRRRRDSRAGSGYGADCIGTGPGSIRHSVKAPGIDAQREPRSSAEIGTGTIDVGRGQVQRRRRAG